MIRVATTLVVVMLAAVAAVVSYKHILEVVTEHGESGWVAYLVPLCIDGLLVAASLVLLDSARRGLARHWLSWVALAVGIALTLGANVLHGLKFGPIGAITSGLPAVTLTIAFELLMGLIRRGAVPAKTHEDLMGETETVTAVTIESPTGEPADPGTPTDANASVEPPAVPAVPVPSPAPTPVLTPAPDALFPLAAARYADALAEGQVPALTRIKRELKVGQPRAVRIRTYLGQLAES